MIVSNQPSKEIKSQVTKRLKRIGLFGISFSFLALLGSLLFKLNILTLLSIICFVWVILFPFGLLGLLRWIYKDNLKGLNGYFTEMSSFEQLADVTHLAASLDSFCNFDEISIKTIASYDQIHQLSEYKGQSKMINKLIQTVLLCRESQDPSAQSYTLGKTMASSIPYDQLQSKFIMTDKELSSQWPLQLEFFDVEDKSGLTHVHSETNSNVFQIMYRGELETVLNRATHILTEHGIVLMDKVHVSKIMSQYQKCCNQMERVFAYAFKTSYVMPQVVNGFNEYPPEENLIYLGYMSLHVPLIDQIAPSRYQCLLISEEPARYLQSVGKQIGLLDSENRLLEDTKLRQMTNEALLPRINRYAVFSIKHESDIVRVLSLFQRRKSKILALFKKNPSQGLSEMCTMLAIEGETSHDHALTLLDQLINQSQAFRTSLHHIIKFFYTLHLTEAFVLLIGFLIPVRLGINLQQLLFLNWLIIPSVAFALFKETAKQSLAKTSTPEIKVNDQFSFKPVFWLSLYFSLVLVSNTLSGEYLSTGFYLLLSIGLISYGYMLIYPQSLILRKIAFDRSDFNLSVAIGSALIILITLMPPVKDFMHFDSLNMSQYYRFIIYGITPILLRDVFRSTLYYWKKVTHFKNQSQ